MVKIAKLSGGEVVVGEVDLQGNLLKVVSLTVAVDPKGKPGQFRMGPSLPPFQKGPIPMIKECHVVYSVDVPKEIEDGYRQAVSGLVTPSSKAVHDIEHGKLKLR